jgi:hypothetical protein
MLSTTFWVSLRFLFPVPDYCSRLAPSQRHLLLSLKIHRSSYLFALEEPYGGRCPRVMGARPIYGREIVPIRPGIRAVRTDGKMYPSGKGEKCLTDGPSQAEVRGSAGTR